MPSYEDCIIYTIRSGEGLYVGSTCNFTQRKWSHKSRLNNENDKYNNLKLYKTIRENDNEWDMQPHKLFPCKNKMEMEIEEERCRVELNADLNSKSCYGKDKESMNKYNIAYRENNKEKVAEYNKEYNKKNKEIILQKQLVKITCECGCEVANGGLIRHQKTKKHLKRLEENQKINKNV